MKLPDIKAGLGSGPKKMDHATCKQTLLLDSPVLLRRAQKGGAWAITSGFLTFHSMPTLQDWLKVIHLMSENSRIQSSNLLFNVKKMKHTLKTVLREIRWSCVLYGFYFGRGGAGDSLTIAQGREIMDTSLCQVLLGALHT